MKKSCIATLLLLIYQLGLAEEKNILLVPSATIAGNATVCQNAVSPLITFTGSGGTAPYTFTYTINGGANLTVTTTSGNSITVTAPTGTAGTFTYSLVSVRDSTLPVSEQTQSGTAIITIRPQPDATINGTGSGTFFGGIPVFRVCNNAVSTFIFINASSSASTINSNYTIVWGDGTPNFSSTSWSTPLTHDYQVGLWNMSYTIQSSNGCNITKNYIVFVGSNPAVSLGNPGNTDICSSSPLTFPITGTTNNPPGTTYTVTFSDLSPAQLFTHPPPASVTHTFAFSSCGYSASNGVTTFQNSFSANIVAENPCGSSAIGVVPIYVSTPPVANFSLPTTGCTNTQICITNTSTGAYENNGSNTNCNTSPKFVWSITPASGFTISSGSLGNDFGSPDPNLWISGTSPLCINFTQVGTYTITIKTGNRCGNDQITKTICIEPPFIPQFTLNTNTGCIPLTVTASNTTNLANQCSPPTYLWSVTYASDNCSSASAFTYTSGTSATSVNPSFNFTDAGTYSISVTMTNSCGVLTSAIQTVVVKKPPIVAVNPIINSCGTANINPTALVSPCAPTTSTLSYAWSFPGGTPSSSTSLNPGMISYPVGGPYTVSLVATNECGPSNTATQTFTVNTAPVITNTVLSQTICSGSATTLVNLTANPSGTAFSWTATATAGITGFFTSGTNTIPIQTISTTNSSPGTVTYVITPTIGSCSGTPVNYVITVNPAPTITTQPTSSTVCLGGIPTPLTIALNSSSVSPTYQWYSNTANSTTGGTLIPGATSNTFNPPSTTTGTLYYYCIITLSSAGCSSLTSNVAEVTITPVPTITTQPNPTQNLCVGKTIPTPLTVSYTGGTGTVTYQWYSNTSPATTGGSLISGATNSNYTPPVFTTAATYYYYVVISLAGNNCGTITSNVSEVIVYNDPTVTTEPLSTQTLCQGATPTTLQVVAAGGIGTFTYQWYSSTVNSAASGILLVGETNSSYIPPTNTAGTLYYYCIITQLSGIGCNVTSAVAAVIVNLAPAVVNQPPSSTICLGATPTTLSLTYANGAGIPNYQWFSNTTNSNSGGTLITGATNATFNPPAIPAGTVYYYCEVTFPTIVGPCSLITTAAAEVIINQNPVIAPETTVICSSTTFTVTPTITSGNIIPLGTTYTWTTPTINPAGSITGATSETVAQTTISQTLVNSTTSPATVTYTVTPISGTCIGNSFSVTVTVNPSINPNAVVTNNNCFGVNSASITTNITGGIPFSSGTPYQLSWTGPNGYTSTATSISSLQPGTYNVTIADAGGCPFSNSYTINEPADIVITVDGENDITCFSANNGSINISVTGGTGAYTYNWTRNTSPFSITEDLSNLSPGTYVVTVTDVNNCGPKTASFTITEPPLLVVSLVSQTNVLCFGAATGAITVSVVGGTPETGYNFSWIGPNGFASTNQNLTAIAAGTYNLIVTDANACVKNLSVIITQSTEIIIAYTTTPITCYGDNNASLSVTLSGGNPPYQFQWSNLSTSLSQTNLSAGNYIITVTDNVGCIKTETIVIPEAPIFTVNPIVSQITCNGANNGSINLNLTGGIAPVALTWSDGSTAGLIRNNLAPGTYTASISDGTPCFIVRTFTIIQPLPLVLSANLTNSFDCTITNTGAIDLVVVGGTLPYTYSWSNGATTEDLSNLTSGNYLVNVTDANGCNANAQYPIIRQDPIVITVATQTDFDCAAHTVNQQFVAQVAGGIPPYQLQWSSGTISGVNNEIMETNTNGTVLLTVTDSNNCTATYTVTVDTPILGYPSFDTTSFGFTTYGLYSIDDPIQFQSTITGDYLSVSWDFGDGTFSTELNPVHTYLIPRDYIVTQTVTYPFGCVYVQTISLLVEKGYVLVVPTAFTPNNDTLNDTYRPVTKGLKNVVLDIYDTWGSLIYSETGDVLVGWDGKIKGFNAENGNYYSKVRAETFYGTVVNSNQTFVFIK